MFLQLLVTENTFKAKLHLLSATTRELIMFLMTINTKRYFNLKHGGLSVEYQTQEQILGSNASTFVLCP